MEHMQAVQHVIGFSSTGSKLFICSQQNQERAALLFPYSSVCLIHSFIFIHWYSYSFIYSYHFPLCLSSQFQLNCIDCYYTSSASFSYSYTCIMMNYSITALKLIGVVQSDENGECKVRPLIMFLHYSIKLWLAIMVIISLAS